MVGSMIKLICSDVDGTIVPDGSKDINPEYFDVILKLRAKGQRGVLQMQNHHGLFLRQREGELVSAVDRLVKVFGSQH